MDNLSELECLCEKYDLDNGASRESLLELLEKRKVEYHLELAKCFSQKLESEKSKVHSTRSSISSISEIVDNERRRLEYSRIIIEQMNQWKMKIEEIEHDIKLLECLPAEIDSVGVAFTRQFSSSGMSNYDQTTMDCGDVAAMMEGSELKFMSRNHDNKVKIMRPVYTQHEFDVNHGGTVDKLNWKQKIRSKLIKYGRKNCSREGIKTFWLNRFPFIMIMINYRWKSTIVADLIAGLIVGVMQIPQGMGYALLAGLQPQYGLYVSFFPAVVYFFFGTSRHDSMGTIAIISLMSGNYLANSVALYPLNVTIVGNTTIGPSLGQLQASRAAGLTFCVGLFHLLMGIFQLGFITRYLSDPLVSGFTVGAAISVFTSQVTTCFGLSIPKQTGNWNIPLTYYQVFKNITGTNMVTLALTLICVAILIVTKQVINPRVVKKIRVPIPMDLILVICGTLASYFLNLNGNYHVSIVGTINKGLPAPVLPDLAYMSASISDIFITAIIAFSISVSLAKIFSKKHGYPIDANQECLAYGIMNVFSSFFLCYTAAASLSRSAVQESIGGKTQLTSIIASILVLFVVLFIGPLFYSLPTCILSSIIVVALKGMFMQFVELKELWLFSIWDFVIWVVAFLATVIIDIPYGLLGGLGLSIVFVMLRTQSPKSHVLGQIEGTDLYKNRSVYEGCKEINGIKIFRYEGSLYYASGEHFRKTLYKKTGINPRDIRMSLDKIQRKLRKVDKKIKAETEANPEAFNEILREKRETLKAKEDEEMSFNIHYVIIDCSTWGYIDTVGVKTLHQVIEEYKSIKVTVLLANPKTDIRRMFARSKAYKELDDQIIYVSVHDAVINCLFDQKMKKEDQDTEV